MSKYYNLFSKFRLNLRDTYFQFFSWLNYNKGDLILNNSIPKSGTHLLEDILLSTKIGKKYNSIISTQALSGDINTYEHIKYKFGSIKSHTLVKSHLSYSREIEKIINNTCKFHFLIIRDPRDIALSFANWVLKAKGFYLYSYCKKFAPTLDKSLMLAIKGCHAGDQPYINVSSPDIVSFVNRWSPWLKCKKTIIIKYEDLIGGQGGASEIKRLETIKKIYKVIGVDLPKNFSEKYYSKNKFFLQNPTYKWGLKKGKSGWKKYYTKNHLNAFNLLGGKKLLKTFGYK